ncbi:MAG: TIGR02569 family protein [Pseudonocardia sp.]
MTAVLTDTAGASLPPHVRSAFGVGDAEPRAVLWAGRRAWHCPAADDRADVLVRPVADNALAAWSASVLDGLQVDGLRIVQPIRSSDGRWVVAGWAACRFVAGTVEPHHDAMLEAAARLHAAIATLPRPRLLDDRDDLLFWCAAGAWGERRLSLDAAHGGLLYGELAPLRRPVRLTPQVVHVELFGALLFDADRLPALVDLVPAWRPAEWAAAIVAVDAVAWGGADGDLFDRWSHLAEWPQMLLRATLHRLALHAQHPDASARSLDGLAHVASLVRALL